MVSYSCKNLSRIELVYKVNANFIEILAKLDSESIPEKCSGYLESGHKKETIYKTKNEETGSKLEFLLPIMKKKAPTLQNLAKMIGMDVLWFLCVGSQSKRNLIQLDLLIKNIKLLRYEKR